MTLGRHIALWLAMTIATIVVGLAPSSASAHEGHGHGTVQASVSQHEAVSLSVAAAELEPEHAHHRGDCNEFCCVFGGHAGCCSAIGIVPADDVVAIPPTSVLRAAARDGLIPSGIIPEALPEPPRPLA